MIKYLNFTVKSGFLKNIIIIPENRRQTAVLAFIEIWPGFRFFKIEISNDHPIITRSPINNVNKPEISTIVFKNINNLDFIFFD